MRFSDALLQLFVFTLQSGRTQAQFGILTPQGVRQFGQLADFF